MTGCRMLGPDEVRVSEPFIEHSFRLEEKYLLSLSPQRLLAGFRHTAGLPAEARRYGGWESTEIQGHTMGHYLTALAQAWAVSRSEEIHRRLTEALDGLRLCQREDGFLFASEEELFDRVEQRIPVWVPWYTMHKLVSGLVSAAELTGSRTARDILSRLCGWICRRVLGWDENTKATVLSVEYGGMNDCLYDAWRLLGGDELLQAAHVFDELPLFEALHRGEDILNGLHANTTIPKILGGLKRYAVLEDCEPFYLEMAQRFWEIVTCHHTYISGGNSEWEHFGLPDVLDGERTACNCETCNTHNMIKLSQLLFRLTGEKKYADYDAWAYVNTILSSQNHETGMTTYFQPMDSGFFKVYSRPFDQFWCCTGTGMENFSATWTGIAFRQKDTLYINRLVSCTIQSEGRTVCLCTDWRSGRVTLDVSGGKGILAVRIPRWAGGCSIDCPEHISYAEKDGYIFFSGFGGEPVTAVITFAMELRRHGLPDSDHAAAYSFGPFMLSAYMGCEDMFTDITGVDVTVPTRRIPVRDYMIEPTLVPSGDFCRFTMTGKDGFTLTLSPHFLKNQERYGIYLREFADGSEALADYLEQTERLRAVMKQHDVIPVGNDQYELAHSVRGELTHSFADGRSRGRIIRTGGYLSYRMNTPSCPCVLCVRAVGEAEISLNGIRLPAGERIEIPESLLGQQVTLTIRNSSPTQELLLTGEIYISGEEHNEQE